MVRNEFVELSFLDGVNLLEVDLDTELELGYLSLYVDSEELKGKRAIVKFLNLELSCPVEKNLEEFRDLVEFKLKEEMSRYENLSFLDLDLDNCTASFLASHF